MKNGNQLRAALHDSLTLREVVGFLGRQRLVITFSLIFFLVVWGLLIKFMTPVYRAFTAFTVTARTQLSPQEYDPLRQLSVDTSTDILTAIQVMNGQSVLGQAYQNAGIQAIPTGDDYANAPKVVIDEVGYTNMVAVTVDSTDTQEALSIARDIPKIYTDVENASSDQALNSAIEYLKNQKVEVGESLKHALDDLQVWAAKHSMRSGDPTGATESQALTNQESIAENNHQSAVEALNAAQDRLASLRAARAALPPLVTDPGSESATARINAIQDEIDKLRAQRAGLAKIYLDSNPQMQEVDAQIKDREQTLKNLPKTNPLTQTRRNPRIDELDSKIADAEADVQANEARLAQATSFKDRIHASLEEFTKTEPDRVRLQNAVVDRQTALNNINQHLQDLQVRQNSLNDPIHIITPATIEPDPVRPRPFMYFAICVLCGCLVGLGLGVIKEHFEDKVTSPEQAVRETEAYILTVIPPLRGKERLTLADSRTNRRVANAVNILKARIETLFGLEGSGEFRSIMLSSFNHDESRSFVARNLAASYATSGKRVILVSVGSSSRLEALGGYKSEKGYGDLLDGSAKVDDVLVATDIPGVQGVTQGQSLTALTVPHVEAVHQLLLDRCDLIIYDGPSYVFPFDIQSLGSSVDATVIIVKPGIPKRNLLGAASDVLRALSSRFLGIVVTSTEGEQVGKDIVRFDENG